VRRRRWLVFAAVLSLLVPSLLVTASAAQAQECAFPVTVTNESELAAAIECFNAQETGEHVITFGADIALTASTPTIDSFNRLHIDGAGHTIDGQRIVGVRPLNIHNATVSIDRLTVTGGNIPGRGGGIFSDGVLTVTRSTITGNRTFDGPQFLDGGGGGIYNAFGGTLTVIDSLFTDNHADNTPFDILDVGGGAILNAGGGRGSSSPVLLVVNSTFTGNTARAAGAGGAIFNRMILQVGPNDLDWAAVFNSTIVGNGATFGGGVYNATPSDGPSPRIRLALYNTVVAGSTAGGDCGTVGSINDGFLPTIPGAPELPPPGHNLIEDADSACGLVTGVRGDIVGQDPALGPLQDNGGPTATVAPLDGSPALDAGDNRVAMVLADTAHEHAPYGLGITTDQRGDGFSRLGNGYVDIGAHERQTPCPAFPAQAGSQGELSQAIHCYNSLDAAGEHVVTLSDDIDLTAPLLPVTNANDGLSLRIDGAGHAIDAHGRPEVRPFQIDTGAVVTLDDLTVAGGDALAPNGTCFGRQGPTFCDGGGIWNSGDLTVTNSTIADNRGGLGGGIYTRGNVDDPETGFPIPSGASTTIRDSVIRDNVARERLGGGGIHNDEGATLVVTGSTISANRGGSGGGITNGGFQFGLATTVTVEDTAFSDNRSDVASGGGIFNLGTGTVSDSTFTGNRASDSGGGIFNSGTATVSDSTFTGNHAFDSGGGIHNSGTLTVARSIFDQNSAFSTGGGIGGGAFLGDVVIVVVNSTVSGNSAGQGGGIFTSGSLTTINSTVSGNSAEQAVGGVFVGGGSSLVNTIVAGNTGNDCDGTPQARHSLIGDDSCGLVDGEDGNLVGVDPGLDPGGLRDNGGATPTIALLEDSPAVDAGDAAACADPDTVAGLDQRGVTRPQGPGCDIGAFELEQEVVDTTPPDITATVDGTIGHGHWYVSDIDITWTVTDDESPVTETDGCDPVTIDTDTTGVTLTCTATSTGGTASESVTVRRDATPPVVTVTGVEDGAVYTLGAVPAAGCDTQDATSGVSVAAEVEVTGGEPNGTGTFTATCTGATDAAGNTADPVSVSYEVTPTAWDPGLVYQPPDRVTHDGKVYEAAWWTRNQVPGDPWGPWQEIAETADGTAIWTTSRIFDTGAIAVHDGVTYRAKWWTRNQAPGDPWGPWQRIE
jgi:chitodextrinase